MSHRILERAFFDDEVTRIARRLLGCQLEHAGVRGTIVECEAYHESEPACHAHIGETRRNRTMFESGGHFYVYRIHQVFCCNIVTGPAGLGAAVLIRALEVTAGIDLARQRRGDRPQRDWTNGPGKLCRALAIDLRLDGSDLCDLDAPVRLFERPVPIDAASIEESRRIGISKAKELPWRFRIAGKK
ncbi:MAG: DNA-3-methyladenine glycosylase [Myxococcales bacterium]|nr:DNA-3-methyladenine glycosylase [Myxococcales bacterium]